MITTLSKLGLTSKEIAEAIWLATQTDRDTIPMDSQVAIPPEPEPIDADQSLTPLPNLADESQRSSEPPGEIIPVPVETTSSLALPPNYKVIPVPDAPAISQALQLARSLRPLARQVALGLPKLIDEVATVECIAETGVWWPILKPESELWLDVALVFDTSPSMCLWQRLGTDLRRLLVGYGEFRDVRLWWLRSAPDGQVNLTSRNRTVHKPSELLTGDRRRLVVIVSDCVAPAWHDGKMRSLIAIWSAKLPTVVLHVFPERLWSRTALARSITVELQGKQSLLPSDYLQPFVRSVWDQERLQRSLGQANVRLPVVTLEPDALASWVQVVTGDRRARTLGVVWDAQPAQVNSPAKASSDDFSEMLKEQIDSFLLLASPTARQLFGLLASAPVITLPIVRLIKQSMLSDASAVHLAEVFMSGLLRVSGSHVPTFENAERIVYELVDDQVRDRLRAGSLVVDALIVLEQVSRYVAQGLGKSVSEFKALLRTPRRGERLSSETEFLQAFATVTAKILRGLGGEFEAIADSFSSRSLTREEVIEPSYDFPPLQPFSFIDAQLADGSSPEFPPPLQTEEFTVTTVQIQLEDSPDQPELEPFEFTVARLVQRQTGNRSEWVVERQPQQGYRWVEWLADDIPLEMVAIPAGRFLMGSPEDELRRFERESPQHEVALTSFWMGRYPVTQAQWRAVAQLPQVDRPLDLQPSQFLGDDHPVERVSWYEAVEFCARLSSLTGRGYRLPTEAEWEYACRAGTTTPFNFGRTLTDELANYDASSTYADGPTGEYRQRTTPVDYFGIGNAFGLSDMHGNVWEWCADHWHGNYQGAPTDGNAWLSENESARRMLRGGSWYAYPWGCRSAYRVDLNPVNRINYVGFRVSCSGPRTL